MERPLHPINWLAELLAAIVIVALLAVLAIGYFQQSLERARMADALGVMPTLRDSVMQEYAERGRWPTQPPSLELLGEGHVVEGIELHPDAFTLTFNQRNPALAGHRLTLRHAHWAEAPLAPGLWLCGLRPLPEGMQTRGEDRTDIPLHMLPGVCQ